MEVYSLKKKQETEELHLFIAKPLPEGKCRPKELSICGKMKKSESSKNVFSCQSEDDARMKCAKIGRQVCGPCVSHLYETYN